MFDPDKTLVDIPVCQILWQYNMEKGKEALSNDDHKKAICHLTLAEESAIRGKDAPRQIEAISWLIIAYQNIGSGTISKNLVSRLQETIATAQASANELTEDSLLLAKAVISETKSSYRDAENAYAWLISLYMQMGLSPHSTEIAVLSQRSAKVSKNNF